MSAPVIEKEKIYDFALLFSIVKKAVLSVVQESTNKTDRIVTNSVLQALDRKLADDKEV